MSSVDLNGNNLFSADKDHLLKRVEYIGESVHIDNGTGINVDNDHAIILVSKVDIIASVRDERFALWTDVAIGAGSFFKLNVSNANLVNLRMTTIGSTRVYVKSVYRSFEQQDASAEDLVDNAVKEFKSFEWLPKITVIAL